MTTDTPNPLTELFGEVIHAYTRAQALADGVLIDVTDTAREAGFRHPVALTAAAWADCVAWTDADERRKPEYTGQDEAGRLWDVLWMAKQAAAYRPPAGYTPPGWTPQRRTYTLLRVPTEGRGLRPRRAELAIVVGPGDNAEPVITIMRPDED